MPFFNCILTSHSLQQHHPSTPSKPANFDASVISTSPAVLTVQATCGGSNAGNGSQLQAAQRNAARIAVLPAKGAQAASDSDFPPLCAPAKSVSPTHSNGIAAKADAARAAMIGTHERAQSYVTALGKSARARPVSPSKRRGDATLFTAPRYAQHVVSIARWLNLRPRFQDGTQKWLQTRPFPFESEYSLPASVRKCMGSSGLLLQLLQKCFGPARHLTDMVLAQLESRMVKRGEALWRELVIPTEVVFHDPRSSARSTQDLQWGPRRFNCRTDLAPREAVNAGHGFAYRTMIFPSSCSAETREPPEVRAKMAACEKHLFFGATLTLSVPTVVDNPARPKHTSHLWCAAAAAAAASLQRLNSQGKFHLKPKIVTLPSPRLCDDFG